MIFRVEVSGIEKLRERISERKLKKAVETGLRKGGYIIEGKAKARAPVRTGRLRSSIYSNMIDWNVLEVGAGVYYSEYVEFGTRKMRAKPFMVPAIRSTLSKIAEMIRRALV